MKQLIQNLKNGETILEEVPVPQAGDQILIQTTCSLVSPGTERMLVEFGKGNLIQKAKSQPDKVKQVLDKIRTEGLIPTLEAVFKRLDEPLPLGYCNAGVIIEPGYDLRTQTSFKAGDRVVSNGPHAEFVAVPQNLCAKIPDNVSDDEASFTVLSSIALQGVRLSQPSLGEQVVVFGLGLIGIITVQLLRSSGCHVLGIDINPERLKLAEMFGAETFNSSTGGDPTTAVLAWTGGRGADSVIITASAKTDDIVHQAADMSRKRGRIILVGVVGLNLRRSDFYEKELIFQVSCSYGPGRYDEAYEKKGIDYPVAYVRWTEQRNFEAILSMMATGRLDVKPLITHRYSFHDAANAYEKILNDSSALGVVLEYNHGGPKPSDIDHVQSSVIRINGKGCSENNSVSGAACTAAMIGAGNYAKMTMAPALSKTSARLKYVTARTNAVSATHIAKKYRFENASTNLDVILNDSEVNTVFIATGHDSHAALCRKFVAAGKHVFVEKPLCLNEKQLDEIISCYSDIPCEHKPILMVGFNRRFSPHSQKIKKLLKNRSEPLAMNFTINAGIIPPNVWVHDPETGGGRIIGEACHFMDLMVFFTESPIVSVSAVRMGKGVTVKDDKMSISMSFEDGSIGTVNYFGNGSKSYPKETYEIFSEGRILRLDNFKVLEGYGFKGFRKFKTLMMDKGHKALLDAFISCINESGRPLIPLSEMINVTLGSFAAVKAAAENRTINIDKEYSLNTKKK